MVFVTIFTANFPVDLLSRGSGGGGEGGGAGFCACTASRFATLAFANYRSLQAPNHQSRSLVSGSVTATSEHAVVSVTPNFDYKTLIIHLSLGKVNGWNCCRKATSIHYYTILQTVMIFSGIVYCLRANKTVKNAAESTHNFRAL